MPPLADAATKGDEPSHPEAEEGALAYDVAVSLHRVVPGSGEGGPTRIFVTAYAAAAAVATIAVGTSVAVAVTLASSVRL